MAGVMLGTAALGNLLQSYSETFHAVCGVAAAFLLVLLLLKLIMYPKMVREDMQNPIMAGVSGTFTMGLMLLSVYALPYIGKAAYVIWIIAIILHVCLIVWFSLKFLIHFDLKKVFTVWYIVYVGIAVAGVSAPAYQATGIGAATFWFGFVTFIPLLIVVSMRYAKLPSPDPAKPLICIFAAPASLCIAAYVQSVMPKNLTFLKVMLVVATILYIFALVNFVRLIKLPFYPSYAAYTFPFVISAIATKQTMMCAMNLGHPMAFLAPIVTIETVIAAVLVIYVFIRYMIFLFGKKAA
jgi:exfoliative toxin A/B